jgi:hypothetical protein
VNVNILDLLAGEVIFNHQFPWLRPQEYEESRHRIKRSEEHAKVLLARAIALSETTPIPSFRAIAAGIGTSTGFISARYPDFVKRVREERKKWRNEQQVNARRKARVAAVKYFQSHLVASPYSSPSRKAALRELRVTTKLPKHLLRGEIKAVWNRLLNHRAQAEHAKLNAQRETHQCTDDQE